MIISILATLYTLLSYGLVFGFVAENNSIPSAVKIILTLISPIVAPVMFGVVLGLMAFEKLNEQE